MAEGRGAWTQRGKDNGTSLYALKRGFRPRDGALKIPTDASADEVGWYHSVHLGVLGIQVLLAEGGYLAADHVTGIFDSSSRKAVKAYQAAHGITVSGQVGTTTMTSLVHPWIRRAAKREGVAPKWLYGLARQESGLDPGAQGWTTPGDCGLWQFNTLLGTSRENAFDPRWASRVVAKRWAEAMEVYDGKVDCCIIQHRSPVAARHLYETGEHFGPESEQYVKNVRAFAEAWTTSK